MYDVIIIGAGAAGLSAALWCDDLKLSALILEEQKEVGGQLLWVYNAIQNYPGAKVKNGRELRDAFASQLADRKFNLRTHSEIESVDLRAKQIKLRSGEQLQATSIIIATGVRRRNLQVPGEKEFAGRGVFESATRERKQMAGRDVCVVGGGDAAAENALLLAQVCPNVTLVHRGEKLRARREFIERLRAEPRVKIFTKAKVQRIVGAREVEGVEILIADATKSFVKDVRGVLVRIGVEPNTELFRGQVEFDEKNYIVVTSIMETNIRNVFAAGDVSNPLAPTISGATGAGATAAKAIAARRQESARNS